MPSDSYNEFFEQFKFNKESKLYSFSGYEWTMDEVEIAKDFYAECDHKHLFDFPSSILVDMLCVDEVCESVGCALVLTAKLDSDSITPVLMISDDERILGMISRKIGHTL